MSVKKIPEYWIVMAFVVIVFHINYGLDILVPTNIRWLMEARHDWGTHYLGWAFFRDATWTFPIGNMYNYCYPSGTNIGLTDSIVLPALLLKPFSGLLPEDFQYLGAWLLFCHLMAAHYAIKIFRLYNAKTFYIILGAVFIACNPIIFYRGIHPSLCAHGFILASIYYYLKPATATSVGAINRAQVWLALTMALISPYLWLMIIGFNIILPLKHWFYCKELSWKKAVKYPVIAILGSLFLWYIIGILAFDSTNWEVVNSYGLYSFNLNNFYNSGGFGVFMPEYPWVSPHQYEGYLYLGMGLMLLIAFAIGYLIVMRRFAVIGRNNKYLLPLGLLALLLAMFAITNHVTLDDKVLFEYPLPEFVLKIGNVFRASGRFMWVPYYLLMVFVLLILVKSKLPQWAGMSLLFLIVVVQAYDLKLLYTYRHYNYGSYDSPLNEAKWNALIPHFDRMITYPPFNNHLLVNMDYQDLSFLAVKNNKAISVGYAARDNVAGNRKYTDSLTNAIGNAELSENELYITTPQYLNTFSAIIHRQDMKLDYLDGYYLLYYKKKGIGADLKRGAETKRKLDSVRNIYSGTKFIKIINKPEFSADKIRFNIEDLAIKDNFIRMGGWAFIDGRSDNKGDSLFVTLSVNGKTYIAPAKQVPRADITTAYKKKNLESSGFAATIFTENIEKGDYEIGIAIKEPNNNWIFGSIGNIGEIQKKEKPIRVKKMPPMKEQMGNIDELIISGGDIKVKGWTAFKDADSDDNEIQVVFMGKECNFAISVKGVMRPDVTAAYKNKYRYDTSGFSVIVNKGDLKKGVYKMGLIVRNKITGRESLMITDKGITIK